LTLKQKKKKKKKKNKPFKNSTNEPYIILN